MKFVFINSNKQLRSGWKIAAVMAAYILASIVIMTFAGMAAGIILLILRGGTVNARGMSANITKLMNENPYMEAATQIADFAILMIVIYIFLRIFEKKGFGHIGFTKARSNSRQLIFGLLMGALSMTIIFLVLLLTGNITLRSAKPQFTVSALTGIVSFVLVGIKEEALSRGYCITVLNQMKKPWLSVLISSLIFSSLHIFNSNVKIFGLINIALVGILFGYMFIKTSSLWMPIGYHITWNYFQGNVFGFPVSGGSHQGIFTLSEFNDNILTGGKFGPEAGILTTIVIIIGLIVIWRFFRSAKSSEYQRIA